MKILFGCLVVVLSLWACSGMGTPKPGADNIVEASSGLHKIDAEKLYKINCKLCHGKDGKRGLSGSPDISTSELSLDERIAIITFGKGQMAPFGKSMSEKEIKAVAKYTMKL